MQGRRQKMSVQYYYDPFTNEQLLVPELECPPEFIHKSDEEIALLMLAKKQETLARQAQEDNRERDMNWHLGQAAAYYQAAHNLYRSTEQPKPEPIPVEPSVWDKISVALLTFIIACGLIELLAHVK
jgi:hypothetical protein